VWRRALLSLALVVVAAVPVAAGIAELAPSQQRPTGTVAQHASTPRGTPTPTVTPAPTDTELPLDLPLPTSPPAPAPTTAALAVRPARPGIDPAISLPILTYHWIRVNPVPGDRLGFHLSVTPANFAHQMDFLRFAGVHTLTLGDAISALDSGKPLPPRSVVLTFDDGYADFATEATPVLRRNGLVGTVFVVSGFIGRQAYMNADQVREVDQLGMVVGCHTVNHVDLARTSAPVAEMQIKVSHQQLEALLGHKVEDFAYPYGGWNGGVEQMVLADGFRDAVTTRGGATLVLSQRGAWPRLHIDGADNLQAFAFKALTGTAPATINELLHNFATQPQPQSQPTATPAPQPQAHPQPSPPQPSPSHRTASGDPTGVGAGRRYA
jgi:peptidoglycan/xylan/chitin deacetylase (PgdA/CDA1 family)